MKRSCAPCRKNWLTGMERCPGKLKLGVAKLDAGPKAIVIQFIDFGTNSPPIDPANIIKLIQSDRRFKLAGPDKLSCVVEQHTLAERAAAIRGIFQRLQHPEGKKR